MARFLKRTGLWETTVRMLRQCRSRLADRLTADAPPTSKSSVAARRPRSWTTTWACEERSPPRAPARRRYGRRRPPPGSGPGRRPSRRRRRRPPRPVPDLPDDLLQHRVVLGQVRRAVGEAAPATADQGHRVVEHGLHVPGHDGVEVVLVEGPRCQRGIEERSSGGSVTSSAATRAPSKRVVPVAVSDWPKPSQSSSTVMPSVPSVSSAVTGRPASVTPVTKVWSAYGVPVE